MVDVFIPEQNFDKNVHDQYFDNARAGTLDVLGATFEETLYYNPANALGRIVEQKLTRGRQGRTLTREEYFDSEHFREGVSVDDEGITEGLAKLLAERHDERESFKTTLSRSRGGFGLTAAQFGVALGGSILDPLNIASAFIPSVAFARTATLASKIKSPGKVAGQQLAGKTTGSRFATGTVDGAIGAAVVEPLVIGAAALEDDDDYTLMDSFLNIALGSALGGGLHAGFGKISDRINKLPASTRDTLQRASIAQVGDNQEVNLSVLIDNVEKTNVAKVEEQAGKKIVYQTNGTPLAVDVIDIAKDGTITVRDVDGTEKILDASNLRSKSSFDEDYEIDGVAISSISEADLNGQAADIDASLQVARDADDAASINKLTADKKAIEVELDRRAGKTIKRPEDPDVKAALASDIKEFKKEISKIKARAKKRKNKNITAEEQSRLAELQEKIQTRETQLQEASDLVRTEQGVLTAQQKEDLIENQQLQRDGLGNLAEHQDAVDEMAADKPVMEDINPDEIEAENKLLEEDLLNPETDKFLSNEMRASIQGFDSLDEKASKFEDISRAGAACIVRR
tara:strand:- start:1384 stop:3099 length:1716 start_codon:yes stop_codon:yes gene_type:complete